MKAIQEVSFAFSFDENEGECVICEVQSALHSVEAIGSRSPLAMAYTQSFAEEPLRMFWCQ